MFSERTCTHRRRSYSSGCCCCLLAEIVHRLTSVLNLTRDLVRFAVYRLVHRNEVIMGNSTERRRCHSSLALLCIVGLMWFVYVFETSCYHVTDFCVTRIIRQHSYIHRNSGEKQHGAIIKPTIASRETTSWCLLYYSYTGWLVRDRRTDTPSHVSR